MTIEINNILKKKKIKISNDIVKSNDNAIHTPENNILNSQSKLSKLSKNSNNEEVKIAGKKIKLTIIMIRFISIMLKIKTLTKLQIIVKK